MAQLPDINDELNALPFDDATKDQLYNAFYAANDADSKKILEALPIPGKLKNDFYERRHNALYSTNQPPATQAKQGQDKPMVDWGKVKENAPRSLTNVGKGLLKEATFIGPMERSQDAVLDAGKSAADAYKNTQGGMVDKVKAGAQAGAESVVKSAISPIFGMIEHMAHSVMHPIDTLEQDPAGLVLDAVALVDPALRAGGAVRGAVQGAKAGTGIIQGAKTGFKNSGLKFGQKKTAPEEEAVTQEPPSAVEWGSQKDRGPVAEWKKAQEPRPRVEGTKPILDKSKRRPVEPPPVVPSTAVAKVADTPPGMPRGARFKSDAQGNIYDEASGNVVDAEIVEPDLPVTSAPPKQLGEGGPMPRFYASQSGDVIDAASPIPRGQPVNQRQIAGSPQRPQLTQGGQRLLSEAAPDPAMADLNSMSAEYGVSIDSLHKLNQLDPFTLEHVAHQADAMIQDLIRSEVANPASASELARASETSRAAKALLKQKSVYLENAKDPSAYPTEAQIQGQPTPQIGDAAQKGVMPETAPPPSAAKPTASAKPAQIPSEPQTPTIPVTKETPAATLRKNVKAAKVSKPATPKAEPPIPVAHPVAAEPIKPAVTVQAQAPVVEPVKSEISTTLEVPTPAPAAPKTEPVKPKAEPVKPKAEAPKPAAKKEPEALKAEPVKSESDHGFKEAPIGKDGKASYRDNTGPGTVELEKGERMFTRIDSGGMAENIVVGEKGGKIHLMDTSGDTIATYPAGTSAEDAIAQKFGKKTEAPKAETPKTSPPPSRGEALKGKLDAKKSAIKIAEDEELLAEDSHASTTSHSFSIRKKNQSPGPQERSYRAVKKGGGKFDIQNDDGKTIATVEAKDFKEAIAKATGG